MGENDAKNYHAQKENLVKHKNDLVELGFRLLGVVQS